MPGFSYIETEERLAHLVGASFCGLFVDYVQIVQNSGQNFVYIDYARHLVIYRAVVPVIFYGLYTVLVYGLYILL